MTAATGVSPEDAAALAAVRRVVLGCPDDAALLAGLRGLPGGPQAAFSLVGGGMPDAFRPERAGGESGLVSFDVDIDGRTERLVLALTPTGCAAAPVEGTPDTAIALGLPTFLRLAFGATTGADAYLDGAVSVTGDVVLAAGFDEWFEPPAGGVE